MNWKPINKVLVGAIVGGAMFLAEKYVPSFKHGIPATMQMLLPYAVAMITAYLVKLEKHFH